MPYRCRLGHEFLNVILGLGVFVAASGARGHCAHAQTPTEYQVKAAFLYNFVKFVEWPPDTAPGVQDAFHLCVVGEDPFGGVLDEAVKGRTINGRGLKIRRLQEGAEARACQIAFISSSEKNHLRSILESLKGTSVLTVGDTEGFAHRGGVINFILEQETVHFEINTEAAERARLKISSKLLNLAKIVREGERGR